MVHGRFWHSAQLWRCLLCSQNLEPSQSRQIWRRLPCSQNAEPPQSRQVWRCLSCSQKLEPPQSRQLWRSLSCWHFLRLRFTGCGAGGGGVAGTARSAGCPRTIDFSCWPFRYWSARPRQLRAVSAPCPGAGTWDAGPVTGPPGRKTPPRRAHCSGNIILFLGVSQE